MTDAEHTTDTAAAAVIAGSVGGAVAGLLVIALIGYCLCSAGKQRTGSGVGKWQVVPTENNSPTAAAATATYQSREGVEMDGNCNVEVHAATVHPEV